MSGNKKRALSHDSARWLTCSLHVLLTLRPLAELHVRIHGMDAYRGRHRALLSEVSECQVFRVREFWRIAAFWRAKDLGFTRISCVVQLLQRSPTAA